MGNSVYKGRQGFETGCSDSAVSREKMTEAVISESYPQLLGFALCDNMEDFSGFQRMCQGWGSALTEVKPEEGEKDCRCGCTGPALLAEQRLF